MTSPSAGPDGAGRRRALLLACATSADPTLPTLHAPAADALAVDALLRGPDGQGYEVQTHVDATSNEARIHIEDFFRDATTRDLQLLFFSGHGVLDAQGRLHFIFSDSRGSNLGSTAVSAEFIRQQINDSRSRRTIVLLDCCYSGAFVSGMQTRAGRDANVASLVQGGTGIAVLTASGRTEYSLEAAQEEAEQEGRTHPLSYFTEAIVDGISTRAADLDRDGQITVDELYEYVLDRVRSGPSSQRPTKYGHGQGRIVIADTGGAPARHRPDSAADPMHAPQRAGHGRHGSSPAAAEPRKRAMDTRRPGRAAVRRSGVAAVIAAVLVGGVVIGLHGALPSFGRSSPPAHANSRTPSPSGTQNASPPATPSATPSATRSMAPSRTASATARPTASPTVRRTGTQAIADDVGINLDSTNENWGGGSTNDLNVNFGVTGHQLRGLHGGTTASVSRADYASCRVAKLSTAGVPYDSLAVGQQFCARTPLNRLAAVTITSSGKKPKSGEIFYNISIVVWETPT